MSTRQRRRLGLPWRSGVIVAATAALITGGISLATGSFASTTSASTADKALTLAEGDLVVATNGSDSNAGTLAGAPGHHPAGDQLWCRPGGTIAVRGGTYALTTNIQITKSGTSTRADHPDQLPEREAVVIDGENLPYTPGAVGASIPSSQPRRDPHGGVLLEDHRPGDRPRAVRASTAPPATTTPSSAWSPTTTTRPGSSCRARPPTT